MLKIDAPVQLIEQVYDIILKAICHGDFQPNERITQEGLAAQLGVSRQPILQAIHLLKRQGFVADAGKKGMMITPIDPYQLVDLYQIRAALDALAARQAARKMQTHPDRQTVQAGKSLIAAGYGLEKSGSMSDRITADMNFHQCIYRISGNRMIEETTALHWHHIRRAMGAILQSEVRPGKQVWAEHEAIFTAIIKGNAEMAGELARQHAESAAEHLASVLMREEYASKRQQA